jgi:toxin ParE1/3/4
MVSLYRVVMGHDAIADLIDLKRHIEDQAGADIAGGYINRIERFCRGLDILPHRGASRDDVRKGVRILVFERRVTIAYRIKEDSVIILRVFGAGQDVTAELENPE